MKKLVQILFALLLAALGLLINRSTPLQPAGEQPVTQKPVTAAPFINAVLPNTAPHPESNTFVPGDYEDKLIVSELMSKNKAALPNGEGRFADWVELENISGEALPLSGWALSDFPNQLRWVFPDMTLDAGERALVFFDGSTGPDFSLSLGETLYLYSPDGQVRDQVLCASDRDDCSLVRGDDGSFSETCWVSPGYPNDLDGYLRYCEDHANSGLVIYEAVVANDSFKPAGMREACDWVEVKNSSKTAIALGGYTLSDKSGEVKWTFPEQNLGPGEILLICCHNDAGGSIGSALNTGFSLSASGEQLFLRDSSGALVDYMALHDLTEGGSMGRMDGQNGFFYFSTPTPGENNTDGQRRVSDQATAVTPDGIYNEVDTLSVVLASPGEIHYTTDGTVPTPDSPLYTEPISVDRTTVIRTLTLEEGALPSRVQTLSYIVNENHTLPVLSLVVDNRGDFRSMYNNRRKHLDLPANLALYDGENSFNHACDVCMKGYTSLQLPKRSLGVSFKGKHGGDLDCDIFGNGITDYSSLAIRAGQDYTFSIFRNELFQDLCLEANGGCLTQASKYCILYINGEYWGIYCLKEDFSKQYYASHAGVSKDSVVTAKTPVDVGSEFYDEVLKFIWNQDLTIEENYQYVCDHVDIDALIDWFILESYCANTDIQGNTKLFRSPENGNRWTVAFYDLDWGFYYTGSDFTIIMKGIGNAGNQMPPLCRNLLKNRYFRDKVLYRFAELNKTVLSNEHVLAKIDEYQALLEPEVPRERKRWDLSTEAWYLRVDELRKFITNNDWEMHNINQICRFLNVGEMEREQIFGR